MRPSILYHVIIWLEGSSLPNINRPYVLQDVESAVGKIPVFVRFKKCGTGTVANSLFHKVCYNRTKDPGVRIDRIFSGEEFPEMYFYGGKEVIAKFIKGPMTSVPSIQLYTILRNPLATAVSAIYFWGRARGSLRRDQVKRFDALPFGEVTWNHVLDVRKCDFIACKYFGNKNPRPIAMISRNRTWGPRRSLWYEIDEHLLEEATNNLRRDFIVGITERLEDFVAMVVKSIDFFIDARLVCPNAWRDLHRQGRHSKFTSTEAKIISLPHRTIVQLNATLQQDWRFYHSAASIMESQYQALGGDAILVPIRRKFCGPHFQLMNSKKPEERYTRATEHYYRILQNYNELIPVLYQCATTNRTLTTERRILYTARHAQPEPLKASKIMHSAFNSSPTTLPEISPLPRSLRYHQNYTKKGAQPLPVTVLNIKQQLQAHQLLYKGKGFHQQTPLCVNARTDERSRYSIILPLSFSYTLAETTDTVRRDCHVHHPDIVNEHHLRLKLW